MNTALTHFLFYCSLGERLPWAPVPTGPGGSWWDALHTEGSRGGHKDDSRAGPSALETELGVFSLEERRLRWHLISAFQYLKEPVKEKESDFFTWTDSGRTKGNGFKVKDKRF